MSAANEETIPVERLVICNGHKECTAICEHKVPHLHVLDEYTDTHDVFGCDEVSTFCIMTLNNQQCVSI